jgi:hypothetical protein
LYGSFPSDPAKLSEAEQLYYGLFLLSAYKPGAEVALEIDGLESRRTLVLLTRSGNFGLSASHEDKLFVVDLSRTDDPTQAKKLFFDEVKKHLAVAARSIEQGRIEPTSGDHCSRCDLGELCRRHPEFSDDDSPFSADWREHDGD